MCRAVYQLADMLAGHATLVAELLNPADGNVVFSCSAFGSSNTPHASCKCLHDLLTAAAAASALCSCLQRNCNAAAICADRTFSLSW
jgi:hypothetical protein